MSTIAIIHTRSAAKTAGRLKVGLLAGGLVVEAGGAKSGGEDSTAIGDATAVIVLWSPAAVRDHRVVQAALRARRKGVLIQCKVRDCDVPAEFGGVDGVILTGWNGDTVDARFQKIANAARALVEADTPAHKRRPRKGVGWVPNLWRNLWVRISAAAVGLASVVGVVSNLGALAEGTCDLPVVGGVCRSLGVGSPEEVFVEKLNGRWGGPDCEVTVVLTTEVRKDLTLVHIAAPERPRRSLVVTSVRPPLINLRQVPAEHGTGRYEIRMEDASRLELIRVGDRGGTELVRCDRRLP